MATLADQGLPTDTASRMAEAREIPCPTCATPRSTTLTGRQRLSCGRCGAVFLASNGAVVRPGVLPGQPPSPAPSTGAPPAGSDPPAPAVPSPAPTPLPAPAGTPSSGRRKAIFPPAPPDAPAPVPLSTARRRSQLAGARGGSAVAAYRDRVGRK